MLYPFESRAKGFQLTSCRCVLWQVVPATCMGLHGMVGQVVIFEKNTFLVITRAHTKEMQVPIGPSSGMFEPQVFGQWDGF